MATPQELHSCLFKDVAADWLELKRKLLKPSSLYTYTIILRAYLLPLFGDKPYVTESEAQQMVVDKIASGLSRHLTHDILAVLKSIMKHGLKMQVWSSVPWNISYPSDTSVRKLPVLSLSDHRRLLSHLSAAPDARNIGVMLSLCTGMRIGEVCGLRWSDVDLKARVITVGSTAYRLYDPDNHSSQLVTGTPKTQNSYRQIPMCRELYDALRTVRRTVSKSRRSAAFVLGGGDTPRDMHSYRSYFNRLLERLNIPKIVFHGLRHTFATRCIECGCDYKAVSALLGHSTVTTTLDLYVHPNLDQKKKCMDKFARYAL